MTRRFLLNDDGERLHILPDEIDLVMGDAVGRCPDNVSTYLICAGAGKFPYPTRVGDVRGEALYPGHHRGTGGDVRL